MKEYAVCNAKNLFAALRQQSKTYAREAHETGLPLMRPMFLEYPADMETFSTDAQFMFGSELLVAPPG